MTLTSKVERLDKGLLTKVFGDSGTDHYGGYFSEEPNPVWRDRQRVDMVEEMRRGDGAVKAVLNAIKSPILSTQWYMQSAGDDDKDKEISQFVEDQLFNMPMRTWDDFLRELMTYFDFGHSLFVAL